MTKGTQGQASTSAKKTPAPRGNAPQGAAANQPRVVSRPEDVAGLVLMQIDLVNARKDDLTIAIKGLSDLTRQLVRAYGENTQTIGQLQAQVTKLSGNGKASTPASANGKRKTSR